MAMDRAAKRLTMNNRDHIPPNTAFLQT